jgi:hypothetical protein
MRSFAASTRGIRVVLYSTIVLRRNPNRAMGADAVFIANFTLPIRRSAEGYPETIPDLGVEVLSKNDTQASPQPCQPAGLRCDPEQRAWD